MPLLFYFFHLFLVFEDFSIQPIVELDEYYYEPKIVDDGLEVEEVGVPRESVKPCDPQKQCVQNGEGYETGHQKLGFQVLVGEAHVAADEQKLKYLDVDQKRILIQHDLDESNHEDGVAFDSENTPLIFLDVMLCGQSYNRVSFTDNLSDLEQNKCSKNQICCLEEIDVLFEYFD